MAGSATSTRSATSSSGSGTGELRGLRGEAAFAHDDAGARLTLTFVVPDD